MEIGFCLHKRKKNQAKSLFPRIENAFVLGFVEGETIFGKGNSTFKAVDLKVSVVGKDLLINPGPLGFF